MKLIEKLREILGLLSGYKKKYDESQSALKEAETTLKEAEKLADVMLAVIRSWNGQDKKT